MKSLLKKIIIYILEIESRTILKKYNPHIIAITGSVGKTSTKDAIYTVLASSTRFVRKSQKSFNSEIGVPLTILGCENGWSSPLLWLGNILHGLELIIFKSKYPDTLVLEVGADHPGDIAHLTRWLKPDVVVVTKVSAVPVHVEFFPSREALLAEKAKLVEALKPTGTLILSYDDTDVRALADSKSQTCLTYGMAFASTVSVSNENILYEEKEGIRIPSGMSFKLKYGNNSIPLIASGVLGIQQVYPFLAATAVGISLGMLITDIVTALGKHIPPAGRMNIIPGIKDSVLIDDTYNSSPDALREALLTLGKVECTGKKIAVLGDMLELGTYSIEEHKKAGELARQIASVVVTVGQRSRGMGEGIISFNSSSDAGEYVRGIIARGDVVLVKGSQSMRMERVVKVLLRDPEKAKALLVRQDDEWLSKK